MDLKKEQIYFKGGWEKIIGLDEAGRGSLAGPVYAAAVMIEKNKLSLLKRQKEYSFLMKSVKDSKKLSPKKRKEIFEIAKNLQKKKIINYQISFISEKTIDRINIDKAVKKAMENNLKKFQLTKKEISKTLVLIDGNRIIKSSLPYKQIAVVKGDNKFFSIALASILAKVERDKKLEKLSQKYPAYNFEVNKGYPTFNHKTLLKIYGPSLIHRQTFQPVKYLINKDKKMKGKKKKIIVILGPTASGKSDLAIQLAKLFNGEIISADSRQVYKGMNLGTGKVGKDKNPKNQYYSQGVKHYLLDIVSPKKYFSLADFLKLADKAVEEIFKKGRLPIICGGTGFYISALIEGWQLPKVKPNKRLRKKLEKKSKEELFQLLKDLDPQKAKKIDKNNRPRLIRAIEIASTLEKVPALVKKPPDWDILIIGTKKDRQELKNLISQRLEKRLNLGMISEVKNLKKQGVSSRRLEGFGLEYRFLNRYLEEKISFEEMKKQLLKEINNYAKRQMTWFRKIKNVHWVEKPEEAVDLTKKFLNKKG